MLETIHEYAREKLEESGEAKDVQRKHAEYFAAFAQQAAPQISGPQQAEWLLRLDEEHDNLRAALRRSLSQPLPELAATLASNLERFWMGRGYFSEARRWFEEVLTHRAEIPKPLLGITLRAAANQAMQVSESRGEQLLLESIETFRELGDKRGTAMSLNNLGNMLRFSDTDRAQALLEESLRLHEEIGNKDVSSSRPLYNLASVAIARGDYELAEEMLGQYLQQARERKDESATAGALEKLADLSYAKGNYEHAMQLGNESLAIRRKQGERGKMPGILITLGYTANSLGGYKRAMGFLHEGLALAGELEIVYLLGFNLAGLAGVAALQGNGLRAARLFGAVTALSAPRGGIGSTADPVYGVENEGRMAEVQAKLGEAAWERAWTEGRAMTMEGAIEYALEDS